LRRELSRYARFGITDIVDQAIDLLLANAKDSAVDMLTSALARAVMVKLAGLESEDERVRQDAASEVIDRVLGKATSKTEITGVEDAQTTRAGGRSWRPGDVLERPTSKHTFAIMNGA